MEEDVDNGIIHQEERKKYSEAEEETLSFEYRIEELGRKFSILVMLRIRGLSLVVTTLS